MVRRSPPPSSRTSRHRGALLATILAAMLVAAAPASAATVSGQVTNGTTGLADICVVAYDATQDWTPGLAEVTTNSVGQYVLTVNPGQYKIQFRHCPLSGSALWVPEFYDDEPLRWNADWVDVRAGDAAGINAVLQQGYTISGRVTSNGVTGIENICVQAFSPDSQPRGGGATDANGDYTTQPVPPGIYRVQFTDCNQPASYASEWFSNKASLQTADPIDISLHGATGVNATLAQGHTISGTITSNGVDGIQGACYGVFDAQSTWLGGGGANPDGTYMTAPLPPGQYRIQFSDCQAPYTYLTEWYDDQPTFATATAVPVSDTNVTGIGAQLGTGRVISGVVTDGAGGVGGICVNANDATQPGPSPSPYGTATAPDGSYALVVPPGQYKVSFSDCRPSPGLIGEWYDDKPDFQTANTVDATTADAAGISAALAAGHTISGRVVIEGTSTGIANMCVAVNDAASPLDDTAEGWGNTQADGTFRTSPVPPGTYKLWVFDCGPTPAYIDEWYDGQPDFDSANPIDLTTGSASGLQIALAPGYTISGRVTDGPGAGIENVCIGVWPEGTTDPQDTPGAGGAMTDPNGDYRVNPLPPGRYLVQFIADCEGNNYFNEWWDDSPDFAGADLVDVTTGGASGIDATLTAGKTITGRVTSDGTTGIANVCIGGYGPGEDPEGQPSAGGTSGADGTFTVGPLHDAAYRLQFNDCNDPPHYVGEWYDDQPDSTTATPIDVTSGSVSGIEVVLAQGRTISGTITDGGGNPIANACVGVVSATDPDAWMGGGGTDESGHYTTQPVEPGVYRVEFSDCNDNPEYVREWFDDAPDWEQATDVDLTSESAAGVDAVLAHGHTVSGTVTDAGGDPIPNVCVSLVDPDEDWKWLPGGSNTRADGTYVTEPAPPGQYKLQFSDCNENPTYVTEWWDDQPDWWAATVVDITPDSVTGYDAVLQAGHVITGTVTSDATGLPIENACLGAVKAGDEGAWFGGGWTGPDGTYRSEPLAPGSYKLQVSDCNDPVTYVREWFDGAEDFATATVLDLTAGDAVADFGLAIGGAVTGTVRAGTQAAPGAPIGGICVNVYVPDGPWYGDEVSTAPDGTYRVGGVPTGSYDVSFSDCREDQTEGAYRWQTLEGVTVTAPATTTGVDAYMGELDNVWPDTFITSGPVGTTDRTTASFTLAMTEPGDFECTLDGQYPDAGSWCSGGSATFNGLADGVHTLQVWASDEAGHRDETPATRTWTVDTSVPLDVHSTKGTVGPGGDTVTDDPLGTGPTADDPLLTAVTAPGAGDVTITSASTSGEPPAGFTFFGRQVTITSNVAASTSAPFIIALGADASLIPPGTDLATVSVFRNGTPVPDCTGAPSAEPDPCVDAREALAGGDVRVTVLSSTASTWNLGLVVTPGVPGKPAGTPAIATSALTVTWTPAAGALSYTLEARDADDAAFSTVATGISGPSYTYASAPPEGTFTFRAKSVALPGHESDWSVTSDPVIVDRTAPTPPTATTDRSPEDPGGWLLNTATVLFAGAGDPAPDGQGSGVDPATVPAPQTFSTTATHTAIGTVRDRAGNQSAVKALPVKVDADAPQVSISCPSSLAQNVTGTATWTATDLGSGLVTPPSGSLALDTATVGTHSATAPVARDAVGHAPAAMSCTYSVTAQPAPAVPKPAIVTTRTTSTSKGVVGVKVKCTGATCTGTLTLRATVKVGGRKKTLRLGSKAFTITAGTSKTVKIRLSKTNLKILKRVRRIRASAKIRLAGSTTTQAKATVTISAPRR